MAVGVIKEEEAFYLFQLYSMLQEMVLTGLITKAQADELREALNSKLHEALGLA